jgi:hypothetical protein
MENPLSWNDTQKLINQALYSNSSNKPGKNVVQALHDNGLLKLSIDNLETFVDAEYDQYQQTLEAGYCGSSLATVLYHKLVAMGAL